MATEKVQDLLDRVDTNALKARSLTDWRPILSQECQVYVFQENYLAKRFDSICYKFCAKDEAKEILIDNLYALLRYKYFPKSSEEIDNRISDIVASFTKNLKTTLTKVSFDKNSDSTIVKLLPDSCLAFRNGVYDFEHNKWLFRYDVTKLDRLSNVIYMYDPSYIITWYLDYDFEPLPVAITDTTLEEFLDMMKELTKTSRNYCFELLYNISHDTYDQFDIKKFTHLCEILGYTCLQSFSQHFVMLIGAGQNGKNSLFDGCFTNRVIPRVAQNDLEAIENDRFITGALENKAHNIFLESTTVAKTYNESKTLKALTGSMYQTIESKGIQKYSGIINCKYIFAANDQDKLKFGDTTTGFRRRINMFEIRYQWDKQKKFLTKGDYYDTTFSDSLCELKDNVANTTAYVYFAMYGILHATKNFTKNFEFSMNDWNMKYADVDIDLKDRLEHITLQRLVDYMKTSSGMIQCKAGLYDVDKNKLYSSNTTKYYGVVEYNQLIKLFETPEDFTSFFSENDILISVRVLQAISGALMSPTSFTQAVKKIYNIPAFEILGSNVPHVKCTFANGHLKIMR